MTKHCPLSPAAECMGEECQWWVEWEHRGEIVEGCALEVLAAFAARIAHRMDSMDCAGAVRGGSDG